MAYLDQFCRQKKQTRCEHAYGNFISVFYRRISDCCYTPRWMGHAYHDYECRKNVMVIYPFHWLVNLAWWLNYKWNKHRGQLSWIDKKLSAMNKRQSQ